MTDKLLNKKKQDLANLAEKRPKLDSITEGVPFFKKLNDTVLEQLNDDKAEDLVVLDLVGKSDIAYFMIIASGRSSRHVASMAEKIVDLVKPLYQHGIHVEGLQNAEWVLVDIHGIIVHIFQPEVRARYDLETLWGSGFSESDSQEGDQGIKA